MVVIFTDGSTGNLQALYLLLCRDDIVIDGIVIDGNIGISNVIKMLAYMSSTIPIYMGIVPNGTCDETSGIESHLVLMEQYRGIALCITSFTTVMHWIKEGAITVLVAFMGGSHAKDVGHHIYSIDPIAWEYVRDVDIPKTLWYSCNITSKLIELARMLYISNKVLNTVTQINPNKWYFWDLIVTMDFLGYLQ
jgi:hypothetical protein